MERGIRISSRIRLPGLLAGLCIVLEWVWTILVVLNCNSVYHANTLKDYHLLELSLAATYALLFLQLYSGQIRLYSRQMIGAVGLALYGVIYLCVRQDSISATNFAYLYVMGLPALYLIFSQLHQQGRLLTLLRKLNIVVTVLAVISLFYWIFGVMLEWIRPNMYTCITWGRFGWILGYDGLHFEVQLDTTFFPGQYIYRNSGIFAEAPMFNLWLNIALAIELFLRDRISKFRVLILVVTVFTTMSVTGILFLALAVTLYLILHYQGVGTIRRALVIVISVLFILPVMVGIVNYSMGLKADTVSYQMRLADYLSGFELFLEFPVFGGGYGNLQSLMDYSYSPNGIIGFSNSLTAVLGTGGLWMSALVYIPHFGALFTRWTGSKKLCCFATCVLFLFCSTAYFSRYIFVVLLAAEMAFLYRPGTNPDK